MGRNIDDLTTVILNWGSENEDGDVNEDGVVNSADLTEIITNWTLLESDSPPRLPAPGALRLESAICVDMN